MEKLLLVQNVSLTEGSDGGNETLTIAASVTDNNSFQHRFRIINAKRIFTSRRNLS